MWIALELNLVFFSLFSFWSRLQKQLVMLADRPDLHLQST